MTTSADTSSLPAAVLYKNPPIVLEVVSYSLRHQHTQEKSPRDSTDWTDAPWFVLSIEQKKEAIREFFSFPSQVDAIESRLHAFLTVVLTVSAISLSMLLGLPWLWLYLTYGFLARFLCGPRLDLQVGGGSPWCASSGSLFLLVMVLLPSLLLVFLSPAMIYGENTHKETRHVRDRTTVKGDELKYLNRLDAGA